MTACSIVALISCCTGACADLPREQRATGRQDWHPRGSLLGCGSTRLLKWIVSEAQAQM